MPVRNSFTMITSAMQQSGLKMRMQARIRYPSWKQIGRPYVLGIIGLAIAAGLWGFGYKLSLYHRQGAPSSQIPVAKLWIESRNASMTAASRFKAKSYLISGLQAFSVPIQRLPRLSRAVACIFPVCTRGVTHFGFLIPFRSPPPAHFLLA